AAPLARPLALVGMAVLVLGLIPILVKLWPALAALARPGPLVAIVLFTLLSLAGGPLLGGPPPHARTGPGLSTASRHPGVAVTIAGAILAADQRPEVIAAVLLCVLVGAVVTGPYAKRRRAAAAPGAPQP